jgi:hypothetical protein
MTGIAFLFGVIGFAVIVHWTFTNERLDGGAGENGLLAMRRAGQEGGAPARRAPRWAARPERTQLPRNKRARELRYRRALQGRLSDQRGP